MTTVKEFCQWLNILNETDQIAIDDGGLTVVVVEPAVNDPFDGFSGPYFELGGIPESEEEE